MTDGVEGLGDDLNEFMVLHATSQTTFVEYMLLLHDWAI